MVGNTISFPIFQHSIIPIFQSFSLCPLWLNKKPQLPGGESWGSGDPNVNPPFPAEGLQGSWRVGQVSWLAASYLPRLPGLKSSGLKTGIRLEVRGSRLKDRFNFFGFASNLLPLTSNQSFVWFSFRSQLRGSGRFTLPSRAVSLDSKRIRVNSAKRKL